LPGAVRFEIGPKTGFAPLISVIVLNYNGSAWLERCLTSVRKQTLFDQVEIIVADNGSSDQSDLLAAKLMEDWPGARTLHNHANLGYSEGNNRAAASARGRYLLFLNTDTWLEPDCIERLLEEMRAADASVAAPRVLAYADDTLHADANGGGFDIFGLACKPALWRARREVFVAVGCSLLIEADLFRALGGFDPEFFMYADEYDLCWRVWLSGKKVISAPSARVHHRGAAAVNPRGCEQVTEIRTSDTKRFYANRNHLLVLLKNSQHLLLVLVPLQLLMLAAEAVFCAALTHRWSHVRLSYLAALRDCWRLRRHIFAERRRLKKIRRHGDFWMLRFLRARINRWDELQRWRKLGLPKVDRT
jgi:GT2 family glycosyltransferase